MCLNYSIMNKNKKHQNQTFSAPFLTINETYIFFLLKTVLTFVILTVEVTHSAVFGFCR